jgi:protein phosphatase
MAHIINVGDSRCYHIEEGSLSQITVDHSLVQEMVEDGMIEPEEAGTHPQRNVVTQALGTSDAIEPDHYSVELSGTLLLCSDGLTEEVDEETIRGTITDTEELERAAAQLVAQANENGGSDNISVVLGRW